MRMPAFFRTTRGKIVGWLLVVGALAGLTQLLFLGWISHHPLSAEEYQQTGWEILTPRKSASMKGWESRQIGEKSALSYALDRTRIILMCEFPLSISSESSSGEDSGNTEADSPDRPPIGNGTATAITSDGYFLTAAHVVDFDHVYLTEVAQDDYTQELEATTLHPVRVIWKGTLKDPNLPDMALIHSALRPDKHFSLLRPPVLSPGAEVVTAGYGGGKPAQSSGAILHRGGFKKPISGAHHVVYLSDAPIIAGDSGGPLMTANGELLGVNVSSHFGIMRYLFGGRKLTNHRTRTVCPDTDWIRKLILKDRAEQKEDQRQEVAIR